jgi:superoxide dismutase
VCTCSGKDLKIIVTHHGGTPFIFPSVSLTASSNYMLMNDAKFLESAIPEQWPILGLSLWEHAFLPCHGIKRELYVDTFWSAIDWQKVLSRLKSSKELMQQ